MPAPPSNTALRTRPVCAPVHQDTDPKTILQLYEQDFDSWEFNDLAPVNSPFCKTLKYAGGSDDT